MLEVEKLMTQTAIDNKDIIKSIIKDLNDIINNQNELDKNELTRVRETKSMIRYLTPSDGLEQAKQTINTLISMFKKDEI